MQANENSQEKGVNGPETELTVQRPSPEELWLEVNRLRVKTQYQTDEIHSLTKRNEDLEQSRLKTQCFLANQGLTIEFRTFHEDERKPDWQKLWNEKYSSIVSDRSTSTFYAKIVDEKTVELFNISVGVLDQFGHSELIGSLTDLADFYQEKYSGELEDGEARDFDQSDDIRTRTQVALMMVKYIASVHKNVSYIMDVKRHAGLKGTLIGKLSTSKSAIQQ